jgi:glutaredoxin
MYKANPNTRPFGSTQVPVIFVDRTSTTILFCDGQGIAGFM